LSAAAAIRQAIDAACHSSLGGQFGERADPVKDAIFTCAGGADASRPGQDRGCLADTARRAMNGTAYHSFGGEVEALNTPTIRRLTFSCPHQLSA
jgi:hypothetical protein